MRGSFADDPSLFDRLMDLLDTVFPGLRRGAACARGLGAPWESVSTPFVAARENRVLSHVGLVELPLVVHGRPEMAGAIHGVATHPEARGKGLYREVMEEALDYCAGRLPTQVLTTEHPEYFTAFGFREVAEHVFTLPVSKPTGPGRLRRLDPDDAGDVALLHRLLERRAPVSRRLGVGREHGVFCFNEGRRPLHYATDLNAILCLEQHEDAVTLFDVVARRLPPLDELLGVLPGPLRSLTFAFAPDCLAPEATPVPGLFDHDGPSHLMVRGPFAVEGGAFALPRPART